MIERATPEDLELVDVARLRHHPDNPRTHDDETIRASVREHGVVDVCVAQRSTGHILGGNGRYDAAVHEGAREVPVLWVDCTDDEALEILLVLNRTADRAGYDNQALAKLLSSIDNTRLPATGWEKRDLAAFMRGISRNDATTRRVLNDDEVENPPESPITNRGDLWQLGPHRLLCGDCTNEADVRRLFGGGQAQLILTDPPYCSGGFQEAGRSRGSIGTDAKIQPTVLNDTLSTRGYISLIRRMLELAPADLLYVFTDWRMWVNLFDVVESAGFGVRNMIVWDKGSPGMGQGWRTQHELIMWGVRGKVKLDPYQAVGNVIQAQRTGNLLHVTQKPVDLLERLLSVILDLAETIYDPFAGAGSTLVACENLEKTACLLELDPGYCDVIIRRWEHLTGNTAQRVDP